MKKPFTCCFIGIFLLGFLAIPGSAQNAEEILKKVIEAQGGRKVLEGIKDSATEASIELIQMGISGSGTMYVKEPNKMRLDMEFMGMVMTQAFDGENGWAINPGSGMTEDMPEELAEVFRHSAFGNSAFLDPDKYGITFAFRGKETLEGTEYLVLDRIHEGGYTITFHIDPETYLITKIKQDSFDEMMVEVVEETIMSDYKAVDGVMTAHTLTILRDGMEFGIMSVTGVKFNTGLEDSFFEREE